MGSTTLPSVLLITGTGTGVGKTVATAAVAAVLLSRGRSVALCKPAQTGVGADEPGDIHEVCRLLGRDPAGAAGFTTLEGVRLRDPLAPASAARREGRAIPTITEHARAVDALAQTHDVVLVEGAGGLLVELDSGGATLADLGAALAASGPSCAALVVVAAGLGTLNHTALTMEALRARRVPVLGLILGAWPAEPDLAMRENRTDLPRVAGVPLLGALPDGAGAWSSAEFVAAASGWLPTVGD